MLNRLRVLPLALAGLTLALGALAGPEALAIGRNCVVSIDQVKELPDSVSVRMTNPGIFAATQQLEYEITDVHGIQHYFVLTINFAAGETVTVIVDYLQGNGTLDSLECVSGRPEDEGPDPIGFAVQLIRQPW